MPPRPMEVKKFMENLVFFGWSLGKTDSKDSCMFGSFSLSLSNRIPRCSDNSCMWSNLFNYLMWRKDKLPYNREVARLFTTYLEENLYENPGGRCGVFLRQPDIGQDMPRESISTQQMREELGNIPQLVCFETMNHRILLHKTFFKVFLKNFINHAKSLP